MDPAIDKIKQKFTLAKCKAILNKGDNNYSDEDIIPVRDLLFDLAEINYNVFVYSEEKDAERKLQDEKIKQLKTNTNENTEEATTNEDFKEAA
jgi:hypothetical protein